MTPQQKRLLEQEEKLRAEAEKLRKQGNYREAITAAEGAIQLKAQRFGHRQPTSPEDLRWLTDMRNEWVRARQPPPVRTPEQNMLQREEFCRAEAERLLQANRPMAALRMAQEAVDLRRQRTHRDDAKDQRWLIDIGNAKVHDEMGLRVDELRRIMEMEYRDKWFDPSRALHSGGRMADAIIAAKQEFESIRERLGDEHPDVKVQGQRLTDLEKQRDDLIYRIKECEKRRRWDYEAGDFENAALRSSRLIEWRRELHGPDDLTVAIAAGELARMRQKAGAFARAVGPFQEAHRIFARLYGEDHWRTRDAKVAVDEADLLARMVPETAARVFDVRWRTFKARLLLEKGDYYDARNVAREDARYLDHRAEGPLSVHAVCLANLAAIYRAMGEYAESVPVQRRALEMIASIDSEEHPDYVEALNNQFEAFVNLGDRTRALETAQRSVELCRRVWGEDDAPSATSLNNLGEACLFAGDHAKAAELLIRSLKISEKDFKNRHVQWTASLCNLAEVRRREGDLAEAKRMLDHALKNHRLGVGTHHPLYLKTLASLADVNARLGLHADAERQLRESADLSKSALGADHPQHARHLALLGRFYQSAGEHEKAEPLLLDSLAILRSNLDLTFGVLSERQQLAMTADAQSVLHAYLAASRELGRPALLAYRHVLGWKGAVFLHQQKWRQAAAGSKQAELEEVTRQLATLAFLQPTPAQQVEWRAKVQELTEEKELLESELAGDLKTHDEPLAEAPIDNPDLARLIEKSRQLEELIGVRDGDNKPEGSAPVDYATIRKVVEETSELIGRIDPAEIRAWHEQTLRMNDPTGVTQRRRRDAAVTELRLALPRNAALVDFLEYAGPGARPGEATVRQLTAFVVRRDRDVARVDLGAVTPIEEAGRQWRELIVRGRGGVESAQDAPQQQVRRLLWDPIERHLEGTDTVLVSPDGGTGRLPLAALPGTEPGKHLIEERALVVVPVPRQLPQLLAANSTETPGQRSLVLVGDVDFGAAPGTVSASQEGQLAAVSTRSAPRAAGLKFSPLPGTGEELAAIAELHRRQFADASRKEVRGADATEGRLRDEAPDCRFLHLATHGFFAPANLRSALASVDEGRADAGLLGGTGSIVRLHPGLLSGIALAGANRAGEEPSEGGESGPIADDGVLTALEVAALDLEKVDLAVLSACETGLGKTAAGEGVLGLQRAFQLAGANATVTSLWKVDDAATQALMVEFYRLLWQDHLGKLEALRQAQLTMLQRYDPRQRKLQPRGLTLIRPGPSSDKPARLPPYYWAAFVLSGDWR